MSRNLLPSAIEYLAQATSVRIAHLVILELPNSTKEVPVYDYLTDYATEVTANGKVFAPDRVTKVGDVRQGTGLTNYKLDIDIAGEYQDELDRALNENKDTSFVGKSMRVLRAYLDDNGDVIPFDKDTNGPMEYFFGNVSSIGIADAVVSGSSKVTWQCAGRFEDFEMVNGRVTDDASHRGLESLAGTSELVPGTGAKKEAYKTDTGFQHANQTINLISKYTTTEIRYKMKSSFFGLKSKLKEYEVEVEKELELGVDLSATYLPFIRGVRRVPGIPVFLDNLKNSPSTLIVVYAICEGPATLLNMYIDGESTICLDENQEDTDMCLGSQHNGDTLSKYLRSDGGYSNLNSSYSPRPIDSVYREDGDQPIRFPTNAIIPTNNVNTATEGINDVSTFTITNSGGVKRFTFYPGSSDQQADPRLKSLAASNSFFAQNLAGAGPEYWDDNSRLLDTAYLVMEMTVTEEEQSIPELELVMESHPIVGDVEQWSLNPADHLEDYLRSSSFGGGLDETEINRDSFDYVKGVYNAVLTSYEKEWANFWRYLGWKDQETHVPRLLECNTLVSTDETVTKNIEAMLNQMDATINQLGGKYHLSIEDGSDPIADISIDEVIGPVNVKDTSGDGKWNAISANLIDPAFSWSANKLVFFDSVYLEQDKGVQKKGNVTFANITNYYVGRNWAKRRLDRSRYSREITIQTYYKYTYLYPNANVTFTYPRFNWDKKKLRVKSTTLKANGLISLTLVDTDDSIYEDISDSPVEVPPTGSGGIPRPQNLRYVDASNNNYNFAENENVYGYLIWTPYDADTTLRYEVENWERPDEYSHNFSVPANRLVEHNTTGEWVVYYPITDITVGETYLFKVRTLDRLGNYSKYALLEKEITSSNLPSSYSPVSGFTAINLDSNDEYVGTDVTFEWDEHPSAEVTDYIVSIVSHTNQDNEYGSISVPATEQTVTFTISNNMSMYANTEGTVGAYREFSARIKAVAPNASSDWAYL